MADILIEKIDETIFEKYENIYNKNKIKENKKEIDETQYGLNKFNLNRLPDKNDPKYIYELTRQLQIYHCKSSFNIKEIQGKCNIDNFEISNNQQFLKNFINDETPYNGLLIFHGVGVGKTCSAINISSSFINSKKNDKKIIALVSKNIQQNWMNTIYDPNKIGNQCSDDIGNKIEDELKGLNRKPSNYKVRRTIKEYYEFYGYLEFSNKIKRLRDTRIGKRELDINEKEILLKQVIREYCSNRILIIDEVHNLREEKESNDEVDEKNNKEREDARSMLRKVVKYSNNMKLIIMSATPIFNKSREIIWLINLLLSNDKRPLLKYKDIFIKKGNEDILTTKGKHLLKKKCSGYISYLRGENPISFPIRIYSNDSNSINRKKNNYPTINLFDDNLITSYKFSFIDLYFNKMLDKGYQLFHYENYIKSINNEEGGELPISERKIGIQLSNIVYSLKDKETTIKNIYGERGFNNYMDENLKKYSYKDPSIPIFDINNEYIKSISSKLTNIITGLKESKAKGIIFIYSDYIYSGVLPIALALEHIGFEKYGGKGLLDYPEWKKNSENTKSEPIDFEWNIRENKTTPIFNRARYIILSGNKQLSPNNDKEIEAVKNSSNSNGENIKIILGTSVTSEGIDFKNIREIHVLDPWYHLYKIEQIIGRGIRFCSHIERPEKERNVTVFLHTAGISKEKESIDTNTYRIAEQKASQIGQIEMILKNNAIDCYLNEEINYISNMKKYNLISSRNKKLSNIDINDQEYSKICSFSNKCNIDCSIDAKDLLILDNINNNLDQLSLDTYTENNITELIKPICKVICEFYEIYSYYTLDELILKVNTLIDTNIYIIYHAINYMIHHKYPVWNKNGISGYLINLEDYYIFQPFRNIDRALPLYERLITKKNENKNIIFNVHKDFEIDIPEDSYTCFEDYNEIHYLIYNEIQKAIIKGWRDKDNKIIYSEISNLKNNSKNNHPPFASIRFKNGRNISMKTINKISETNLDYDLIRYLIPNINNDNYINHIIDKLKFSDKLTLLKNILSSVINNNYKSPKDIYDNYIYSFFKNNLIRLNKNGDFFILNEQEGDIIGFFLYNTEKSFNNTIKSNINNFSFLIFEKETKQWIDLDEVGKLNIKANFKPSNIFDTSNLWGYSYKNKSEKHLFKIIRPSQRISKDKLPGKILEDVLGFKSISLLEIFKENFPDYFSFYEGFILNLLDKSKDKVDIENKRNYKKIKDETELCSKLYDIANKYFVRYPEYNKLINKDFLVLYGEFIMRDLDLRYDSNYYLSYDLFLLKFGL